MNDTRKNYWAALCMAAAAWLATPTAQADAVTEWNAKANEIVAAAKLPPHPSYRAMAMVQAAVYEAVNGITRRYPATRSILRVNLGAEPDASIEAAVAAANRTVLSRLIPAQQATILSAYLGVLANIPDGQAKAAGIAVGVQAADAILVQRAHDGAGAPDQYRPRTTAGVYVPTIIPAFPQWPERKPWLLTRADQFRPGPPPALGSTQWAHDYNEVKRLGARNSPQRSAEQSEIAYFWEATGPALYFPVALSVARAPGREVTQNARLLAAAGVAMDDALIAVMEAKYYYAFWRPITAIRNGDADGNAATEREPAWMPLVDTPMHPEYPCAHCILSGALGGVLQAEVGNGPLPTLSTASPTAKGAMRSWNSIDEFMREVANARIYDGVHYRNSTEVGTAMGMKIGALAAASFARARD